MPRKKKRSGGGLFCGCFGARDEPPEIHMEFGPAPTINPDLPMPSDSELDAKFSELVVSIDYHDLL